jgi:hypothetical protein
MTLPNGIQWPDEPGTYPMGKTGPHGITPNQYWVIHQGGGVCMAHLDPCPVVAAWRAVAWAKKQAENATT